jgi:hypothetical protein
MVKKMQAQMNNNPNSQLETLILGVNDENSIYGLEFIVDELQDKTNNSQSQKNGDAEDDWFGLSDLCI